MHQEDLVDAILTIARLLDYRSQEELRRRLSKQMAGGDVYGPHQGRGDMGMGMGVASFRGGPRDHHFLRGGRGYGGYPQDRRRYDEYREAPAYTGNGELPQYSAHHHQRGGRGGNHGGGRGRGGDSQHRSNDNGPQENRKWAQGADDTTVCTDGEKEQQRKPGANRRGRRRPNQSSSEKE